MRATGIFRNVRPSGCIARRLAYASALLLAAAALFAAWGCGAAPEGKEQAEELRSSYREIRAGVAELEGFFPEMEDLLGSRRDEELRTAMQALVDSKRASYGVLLRELDGLRRRCSELESAGGRYSAYAGSLRELLELNREEAQELAGALLVVEDLNRQLPLPQASDVPPFTQRIDDHAERIEELRNSILEGEERAEQAWRELG